jgi:vacuolar-type H+-ATPase subunit C/Vma6
MNLNYFVIPTKDTHYAYTTGRIRALEVRLLREADFSRMKQTGGVGETLQILGKLFSYSESMKKVQKEEDFETGLEEESRRTYAELRSFCPEPELIDLFWLENDFYNLKILLKIHFQKKLSLAVSSSLPPALSRAGTQAMEVLKEAIEKENFALLSSEVANLLKEIFPLVEQNSHPQFLDNLLNKRFFQWLLSKVEEYSDTFLRKLIQLQIDSFNIRTFFRIQFVRKEKELLKDFLMEGGGLDKDYLLKLANQLKESQAPELPGKEFREVVAAAFEEWDKERSLFGLDKFLDELILKHTRCGFYITFGREPLINYIFLKKQELKRLRVILWEKLARVPIERVAEQIIGSS